MFSNMVASLVKCERIETTEAKAKELKRIAERTITWGVSVCELYEKGLAKCTPEERVQIVHAQRMAKRVLKDRDALDKLFTDAALRFAKRPGGYTRVLKTRTRRGDAAPMALVELVDGPAKTS
jgi:large subunit ribosomal protein L17